MSVLAYRRPNAVAIAAVEIAAVEIGAVEIGAVEISSVEISATGVPSWRQTRAVHHRVAYSTSSTATLPTALRRIAFACRKGRKGNADQTDRGGLSRIAGGAPRNPL